MSFCWRQFSLPSIGSEVWLKRHLIFVTLGIANRNLSSTIDEKIIIWDFHLSCNLQAGVALVDSVDWAPGESIFLYASGHDGSQAAHFSSLFCFHVLHLSYPPKSYTL